MSTTSAPLDYEQAGELKIGQVGVANLRVRTLEVAQLSREMRERVDRAPKLFGRAPVIIDFGGLARTPDTATTSAAAFSGVFDLSQQYTLSFCVVSTSGSGSFMVYIDNNTTSQSNCRTAARRRSLTQRCPAWCRARCSR